MELLFKYLFVISIVLIFHSYLLYTLILSFLSFIFKVRINKNINSDFKVSVIVSAYNEEKVIEKTLLKLLKSDFNLNNLEILVGSDCSSDNTNNIVLALAEKYPQIKFYPFSERRGKINVVSDLVSLASGDILVFADANTIYHPQAINNLVRYFSDETIGGVCGRLMILDSKESEKEGNLETSYWEYESFIKKLEGSIGILVGANGGIYAIRKELFPGIKKGMVIADDLYYSAYVLIKRKKFVYCSEAIATEYSLSDPISEFKRKVRMFPHILATVKYLYPLLSPAYGLTSFAFWSHKILRWITPFLLIILFLSNLLLLQYSNFYFYLFLIQSLFYMFAIIGFILNKFKLNILIFLVPFYFVISNIAILIGFYRLLFKENVSFWQSKN